MNQTTNENTLKRELLKQNGKTAADQEVSRLHGIIQSEQRRVRRLFWLTIVCWTIWLLGISLSVVVPQIQAHGNPPVTSPETQPAPVVRSHHSSPGEMFAGMVLGTILLAAVIGLPILGIVLAIMLIVTRRTASLNQVRASLAAIDAQLRMLGPPASSGSGAAQG